MIPGHPVIRIANPCRSGACCRRIRDAEAEGVEAAHDEGVDLRIHAIKSLVNPENKKELLEPPTP